MRIDIATLFPQMCEMILNESIIGRAIKKGIVQVYAHNIRDYSKDKHNRIDDYPYGGGVGMIIQAEPVYQCIEQIKKQVDNAHVVYMSPKGEKLTQKKILEFAKLNNIIILAGHYEGLDQRVIDLIIDEEISIGDYVLTGGELPAVVLTDAVLRCVPGVLSKEECYLNESHINNLLEHAQYTRPKIWRGLSVPEVLLSGHHMKIEKWKIDSAYDITKGKRLDMLKIHKKDGYE